MSAETVPPSDPVALAWAAHANSLAVWTMKHLVNRRDVFGHYIAPEDRRDPKLTAFTDKSALVASVVRRHYEGRSAGHIIGLHSTAVDPVTGEGEVPACWSKWLAVDLDCHRDGDDLNWPAAEAWYARVGALGLVPLLTTSNGRGGYHLRAIFDRAVPTASVYRFGRWLTRDWAALGLAEAPEIFPKQPAVAPGKFGNWLRAPGRHHTLPHWTQVWDGTKWLDGLAAVKAIIGTTPGSFALVPDKAIAEPDPKPARAPRKPAKASRAASGDAELAAQALEYYRNDDRHYDEWIRIGMALSELGDKGLDIWVIWSRQSAKYEEGACEQKWGSFTPGAGVGLGSLFLLAKQASWPGPALPPPRIKAGPVEVDEATEVLKSPTSMSPESERVDAAIKEGGPAGLLRNKELLAALASLEGRDRGEFGAILACLKRVRGFPVKDFRAALKSLHPKPGRRNPAESCYTIRGGGYWFEADTGEGPVKLSNFVARITEEVTVDDGLEPVMRFKVAGTLWDGRQVEADMPAAEFPKMAWVSARFGSEAIPEAGRGIMDQLRAAIQHHSTKVERRVTYTTTGWRLFGGDWKYLHAGGAIGADGHDPSVLTQLKGSLGNYRLPPPPPEAELRDCVRAALGLSRLHQAARPSSKAIAAVSLAAPWRAAIGACNFAIQAAGVTGSFKTTWAALLQQHFGAGMNARGGLPLSWGSTANLIETQMYAAAHAIQVIDDFVPGGNDRDLSDIHKLAERVFRAQGNNLGRQRLNPDGTPKPDMPPRGLPVSTGEDRVRRRSADARTLPLRFSKDDPAKGVLGSLDPTSLARCQADADAGLYAGAMAGFLQHIAGRYEETRAAMEERAKAMRPEVTRAGDHGRTPDIVADLVAGFEVFLSFADAIGAIAPAEVKDYRDLALEGLMEAAGEAKADRPGEVEPGDLFIQLVVAALSGGRVFLGGVEKGDAPEGMEAACGWRQEVKQEGGHVVYVWDTGPNAEQIGWTDGSLVYLEPKLSYQVARRLADTQGEAFPVAAATLHRLLDESKRLAMKDTRNESGEGRGRLTCRKQLQKKQRSVLVLRCSDLWPDGDGSGEGGAAPEAVTSTPPEDVAYRGPAR